MRTKLFLIAISIIATLLFFNCSQNEKDTIVESETSTFTNPYAYLGEGHNKVCKEYIQKYNKLDVEIISKMGMDYLNETGNYPKAENFEPQVLNRFTDFINFQKNRTLNKVTDISWLDSLITDLASQGAITQYRKEKTLSLLEVILDANGDTNKVNQYCSNLPDDIDDTTKAHVLMTAAIYNASYRLWIGDNPSQSNKLSKVQLTILGQDAVGAAIGFIYYIVDYTIEYERDGSSWSWVDAGWKALQGGLLLSIGGAI